MKKILCILLCLMMVIPAAVSMAYCDGTPISSFKVTLTIPKAGATMDTPPEVTVPSGSHFTVTERKWVYAVSGNFYEYDSGADFKGGCEYMVKLEFTPDAGYAFPEAFEDDTKFVTSNATVYWRSRYITGGWGWVVLKFTIEPEEEKLLTAPKDVTLTAVSAKKLKVSWKKLSSKDAKKAKYIDIQISTDKKFKTDVKTKKVSSNKSSYTFTGLKKNTKYYVRVRTYTKTSKVIKVSKWVKKDRKTKK